MSDTATRKRKRQREIMAGDEGDANRVTSPDGSEISISSTPATADAADAIPAVSGRARSVIYCSKEIVEEQDESIPLGPNVLGTFSCHGLFTF
jgi:hypothetical protein